MKAWKYTRLDAQAVWFEEEEVAYLRMVQPDQVLATFYKVTEGGFEAMPVGDESNALELAYREMVPVQERP